MTEPHLNMNFFLTNLFLVFLLVGLTNTKAQAQCTKDNVNVPVNWQSDVDEREPKTLVLETKGIKELKLLMYTRRGKKIFESSSSILGASNEKVKMLDTGWDATLLGKKLRAGIYVYAVEAECLDRSTVHTSGNIVLTVK